MIQQKIDHERILFDGRIATLPPLYREVLRGVREGRSVEDMASLSGISVQSIERIASDLGEL